ncbi:MAG: outer membrane beta-barrel protein [Bacteroidia bacterium]
MKTRTILVSLFIVMFAAQSLGQDVKNIRFGMLINPQLDWERSGNSKLYTHDGINGKFGFGLSLEFKITDVVHFQTGLGGTFSGGGENYTASDTVGYVTDRTGVPYKIADVNNNHTYLATPNHVYRLLHRQYKTSYITIPVMLKMMTKAIGPLKYFGQFGGNLEILTKATADDIVSTDFTTSHTTTNTAISIYSDCIPVKASLNVGAGAEYNISGTTSLVVSLNYLRSFTTLTKGTSDYLIDSSTSTGGTFTGLAHKIYGDGFALSIGILF